MIDIYYYLIQCLLLGGSASCAINVLVAAGCDPKNIIFVNLVAAPEGISNMVKQWPTIKIVTSAIDTCLNENKYIVPGLGDFGDRYFGTDKSN